MKGVLKMTRIKFYKIVSFISDVEGLFIIIFKFLNERIKIFLL